MAEKKLSGYPSIDKPWLKYYSEEAKNLKLSDKTIYEAFVEAEKKYSDGRLMLEYYSKYYTYKDIRKNIEDTADALVSIGVKKGDYVSTCVFISPEVIYLIYACNKIGAICQLINPFELDEEIPKYVTTVNSNFLFTFDMFAYKFASIKKDKMPRHVISMSALDSMIPISRFISRFYGLKRVKVPVELNSITWQEFINKRKIGVAEKKFDVKGEDPCIVFATSGTSGHSKGALISGKAINNCLEQYDISNNHFGPYDSALLAIPMYHAFAITTGLHEPIMQGMYIRMKMPGNDLLVKAFKYEKVNHVAFMPQIWETFVNQDKKIDLSCIKDPITGSDILTQELEDRINNYLHKNGCKDKLLNGFGLTEVCAAACVNTQEANKSGTVGIPFVKTIISSFDLDTGKELRYGELGELCIQSPAVMIGYVGLPEKTKEVLRVHDDGLLWFHTGDLGFVDEDGFVTYKARKARSFYYQFPGSNRGANFKIDYSDIEEAFRNFEGVAKVVAAPKPDKEYFNLPVLLVELDDNMKKKIILNEISEKVMIDKLKKHADEKLLKHLRPVEYRFIDSIPLTIFGKVDYKVVDAMVK